MKPSFSRHRNIFSVILFAGALATLAFAHSKLLKSAPAADAALTASPVRVEIWFAEKPDLAVSKLAIKGRASPIETGPVHANPQTRLRPTSKASSPTASTSSVGRRRATMGTCRRAISASG